MRVIIAASLSGVALATSNAVFQASTDRSTHLPMRRQAFASNITRPVYDLVDVYDASNFWDKFEFFEVRWLSPSSPPPLPPLIA